MTSSLLLFALAIMATPPPTLVDLAPMDHAKLLAEDVDRGKQGEVMRYAVPHPVKGISLLDGEASQGRWQQLANGNWRWEFVVQARGATSIDLGFSTYELPVGASLVLLDRHGDKALGPYTDHYNRDHGEFWTPVVEGEQVTVQLTVPADRRSFVSLELSQVNYGYWFFNELAISKALECNVDTVCPEGDDVRDQIRSVATYTTGSGAGRCSGALINNTSPTLTPYFLTAAHCGIDPGTISSYVFYFNYESATCRTGADSGNMLPRSIGQTLIGADIVATSPISDFLLLRLSESPPPDFEPYYSGWDRRDQAPTMATGIHHPLTHEKRLAIEFDPVVDDAQPISFGNPAFGAFTYWEIREWDVGVTEGGSSGSPLLNENQLIVGQLGGGAQFFCPNADEGSDYYGKLSVAFDAGQTPETRLTEWLDPTDSGVPTLDGSNGCTPPDITISGPTGVVSVGQQINLDATISGGVAPYVGGWDFDGDGIIDSRTETATVSYNRGGVQTARLRVTDATGCVGRAQIGIPVAAPAVTATVEGLAAPSCGDDDAVIEPGEIWTFPITLRNTGDLDFENGLAAFRLGQADEEISDDDFGYQVRDSQSLDCPFDPILLDENAEQITLTADDDGTGAVVLGATFNFFGETFQDVVVSTNGFIGTGAEPIGSDFRNACPYPDADADTPRIAPLHDDLVVDSLGGGAILHQHFDTCPRPADSGNPEQGCDVIEWRDVNYFNSATPIFSFQSILYSESFEISNQYPAGNTDNGDGSTTAIQRGAGNEAITYACNTAGSIPDNSAVCFFHPEAPAGRVTRENADLLTPQFPIQSMLFGEEITLNVAVRIGDEFNCGDVISIDFLGMGSDRVFLPGTEAIVEFQVGGEDCQSDPVCPVPNAPDLQPQNGFWFNPLRPGNGMDLHFGQGLYGAWYTARPDHTPTWYYLQTLAGQQLERGEQLATEILSVRGPVGPGNVDFDVVGDAVLTFDNDRRALFTWTINGEPYGEMLSFFSLDADPTVDADFTDQWFNPNEAGWGLGVHRQGNDEFSAVYFFDTADQPAWTVVLDTANLLSTGASDLGMFESHCPACVWFPARMAPAGSMNMVYPQPGEAILDIDVQTTIPAAVNWQRSQFELIRIGGN